MLSKDEIKHIANLARLGLREEEVDKFQKSLSSILDYVKKLEEVDVSDIKPIANILGVKNVFREDGINNDAMRSVHPDPHMLKDMAPDKEGDYVKVKQILSKN